MANKIIVAPSFLGIGDHSNWNKLYRVLNPWVNKVNHFGADAIHVDFSGVDDFVPDNHDVFIFRMMKHLTLLPIEFHLMTHWPFRYLGMLNDYFPKENRHKHTVIIHPEADDYHPVIFRLINACGFSTGMAINPSTSLVTLNYDLLPELDLITVMTVEPNQSGQSMLIENLAKVSSLAELRLRKNWHYRLEVDGGVDEATAQLAVNAGADILIANGMIQKNPYKIKWLQNLKRES